jgi:hypothetical protein
MSPPPLPELRVESRNNIFVMATMYAAAGSTPVRVRNMSRTGALVEASALPAAGTKVRLSRGSLTVTGDVMWIGDGKAGLRFACPVTVTEWIPLGKRGSGQQLIDEMVHQARVGSSGPQAAPATVEIADEMVQLSQMLERVAEELSFDPAVSSHHAPALQMLDAVTQALNRLALNAGASLPLSARFSG